MTAQRMLFLTAALVIMAGIILTGIGSVHWLLYVPVALLVFAAVTGICPVLLMWQRLGFK